MGGCVVCLIGLPASGKSFLVHKIKLNFSCNYSVSVVSFDAEIPWSENKYICWKEERNSVAEKVSLLLNKDQAQIVILDDNMYYRSMRKEYWKIARKYRAGFCQLYLNVKLETVLSRNASRENTVPDNVIGEMAQKIEAPDPTKHCWEYQSLIINEDTSLDDMQPILNFILEAMNNPLDCIQPPEKRKPQLPSSLHLADMALRAIVNDRVKQSYNSGELVRSLNQKRKDILVKIKSQSIILPPLEDVENHPYYHFLKQFFNDL